MVGLIGTKPALPQAVLSISTYWFNLVAVLWENDRSYPLDSKYPVGARYHRALIPWDNEKSFNKEALSNARNPALSKDSAEIAEQLFRTFIFRLWEVFKL
jgi:hypothetical protein